MCSSFGLLYPVALHDLAITVDTDIPGAARLGLAIEHGGVCNVVVLKHTLLELTLWSKVLLKINMGKGERCIHISKQGKRRKISSACEHTLGIKIHGHKQWNTLIRWLCFFESMTNLLLWDQQDIDAYYAWRNGINMSAKHHPKEQTEKMRSTNTPIQQPIQSIHIQYVL